MHIVLGVLSALLIVISFGIYFRGILRGTTHPHPLSWLIWGMLTGIAFFAQLHAGAGTGSLVTGFTSLSCLSIGVISAHRGTVHPTRLDWISFSGGILALIAWRVTGNALAAVLCVTLADAFGFFPTLRKGFQHPWDDTATTFALDALAFLLGIAALQSQTLTTVLYPATIVVLDTVFVVVLLVQRKRKHV